MFDPELESFKIGIDLRAYAASHGYAIDVRASWRGSAVMRHTAGDKIIIKRDTDGHYVYFSVRDDSDHGTIIDFACRHLGASLGVVRKELRPWIGASPAALPLYPPFCRKSRKIVCASIVNLRGCRMRRHTHIWRANGAFPVISFFQRTLSRQDKDRRPR